MRGGAPEYNTGRPYDIDEYNPRSYSHVPNYYAFDVANNHLSHVRSWDSDRSSSIPNNSRGFGGPVYNALNRTSNSLSSLEVAKNEITSRLSTSMRGLIKEKKKLQDEKEEQQREIDSIEEEIGNISSYLKVNREEIKIFRKKTTMLREELQYQKGKTFDEYIKEYINEHSGYSSKNDDELRKDAIIQLNKDITNREKTSKTMDNDFRVSKETLEALKVQLTTLLRRRNIAQSRIILNNNKKIDFINEAVNEVLEKKGIILDKEKKDTLVAVIEGIYKVNKVGGYKLIKRVVKRPSKPSAKPTKRPAKPSAKPVKRPAKRPSKPSAKPVKRPSKPSAKPVKRPVRK